MKAKEIQFPMPVADVKLWMLTMQQLTAGGRPVENSRERWQTFRWCMMENHQRLQARWDARAAEIQRERVLIIVNCCGDLKRFENYEAETNALLKSFGEYRGQDNQFHFPSASTERRFHARVNELNARYSDVGKAHEMFAKRQTEMLDELIDVSLICCDYSEVPDDVGCAYIGFIRQILFGMPKLRFWHGALLRESRNDPNVKAKIIGAISGAVKAGMEGNMIPLEIALKVFDDLYAEPKFMNQHPDPAAAVNEPHKPKLERIK